MSIKNESSSIGSHSDNLISTNTTTTTISAMSQFTDSSFGNSLSTLPSRKYQDKTRLSTLASSKFEKGLRCVKRRRYSLVRSKFRAALKARILLHEDARHLSIAPVHEMLGMVKRRLREFGKAGLHLGEALEICEGELERLMMMMSIEKEEDDGKDGKKNERMGRLPSLVEQDSREDDYDDADALMMPPSSSFSNNVGSTTPATTPTSTTKATTTTTTMPTINDDRRELLLTNIERIKKTIDIVERDAKKEQIKEGRVALFNAARSTAHAPCMLCAQGSGRGGGGLGSGCGEEEEGVLAVVVKKRRAWQRRRWRRGGVEGRGGEEVASATRRRRA